MRAWSRSVSHPTSIQTCQSAPLMAGRLQNALQMNRGHLPNSLDSVPPAVTERAVHRDGSNAAAQIVATIKKEIKRLFPSLQRLSACQIAQTSLLCAPLTCPAPKATLTAQALEGLAESSGSPAVMHLFCKVRLMKEQACPGQNSLLPRSEWVLSPPPHGSKEGVSAWKFLPSIGGYEGW